MMKKVPELWIHHLNISLPNFQPELSLLQSCLLRTGSVILWSLLSDRHLLHFTIHVLNLVWRRKRFLLHLRLLVWLSNSRARDCSESWEREREGRGLSEHKQQQRNVGRVSETKEKKKTSVRPSQRWQLIRWVCVVFFFIFHFLSLLLLWGLEQARQREREIEKSPL